MSIYGISRLAWDIEHVHGLTMRIASEPSDVLSRYDLTKDEVQAVRKSDAGWLLAHGVNPLVIRNLFVNQGTPHRDLYRQSSQTEEGT